MRHFLNIALLFSSLTICSAQFTLSVSLSKFQIGERKLANGSFCDPFYFAGQGCRINLKICVETVDIQNGDLNVCNGVNATANSEGYVMLGQLTNGELSVEFKQGEEYFAWTNPHIVPFNGNETSFQGFMLKVKAYHDGDANVIDSFAFRCEGEQNSTTHDHPRPKAQDSTTFELSWIVKAKEYPTTPAPTTTPTTPKPPSLDCEDVRLHDPTAASGVYNLTIQNTVISVYCDIGASGSLTIIQSRGDEDSYSFDEKTFDDYKSSFGTPGHHTNFWLGLDNMVLLLNESGLTFAMKIELCCGTTPGTNTFYENLRLSNAGDNYRLHGTALQTIGMGNNEPAAGADINAQFATYNHYTNSDNPYEYCDVINNDDYKIYNGTGGWWFGSCTNNLNGHYYAANDPAFQSPGSCQLKIDKTTPLPNGTGIEMQTTAEVGSMYIDGKSYTRVRMALYRMGLSPPSDLLPFCG